MKIRKILKIQVKIITLTIKSNGGDIMNNFIMCFTEDVKNKLIGQGYELLNEINNNNKTIYYFKNDNSLNKKLTFSKNEIIYTNKMLY